MMISHISNKHPGDLAKLQRTIARLGKWSERGTPGRVDVTVRFLGLNFRDGNRGLTKNGASAYHLIPSKKEVKVGKC